ncbi:MAG: SMC family ATPase [Thermomicrobiales bacterium]|nr:SMC family ATPase [Thermomicrobiales bacterium]
MILSKVQIINYKQYGGSQEIEIPQAGTIGVIGTNGVGKTTLFEAIEWALYSPSTIKAADVRPRTWRGNTMVAVTINDPATGIQYTVERELGKGAAKARIYRRDANGDEEKIVDGAPQVTQYVANNLIGLDHTAFVATFFTRQKELGFFNGSPTTRRREVGKLLGLETIRQAQELIAEERKRAQSDARSYLNLSEEQARDRDFSEELKVAETTIAEAGRAMAMSNEAVLHAKNGVQSAQAALSAIEQLRDQDAVLNQQLMQKQREHDLAVQREANATQELARLTNAERQRDQLMFVAEKTPDLVERDKAFTAQRQAAQRKRELDQHIHGLNLRERDAQASIQQAIDTSPAPDGNPVWSATDINAAITWTQSIDLAAHEAQVAAIDATIDFGEKTKSEQSRLNAFLKRVEELQQQYSQAVANGDPTEQLVAIDTRISELQASTAAAESTRKRYASDLQRSERILQNLEHQHEGEVCPTCQRPFTAADTAHVTEVFRREIADHKQHIQAIDVQLQANNRDVTDLQRQRTQLAEAAQKIAQIVNSLETGHRYVEDQQATVRTVENELQETLKATGLREVPTLQQRESAQRTLVAWRKIVDASAIVAREQQKLAQIAAERASLDAELQTLADATYNEAEHHTVIAQLQEAQAARTTILQIDRDLATRDATERARAQSAQIAAETSQQMQVLQAQRQQLGYDPSTLLAAQSANAAALEQERIATQQHYAQQTSLREVEHMRNRIQEDKTRLEELAKTAEAKRREADDLDQMYREFSEFEKYAAAWYAPKLSEITSDLVSQVTDGKYDRVEFDNNFSIQVYDGDDEKYPYETFSGGERDAIALCSRIALSRVIGGASATPPGFLVLDEVFGSLDLERRQRLLEMLGTITNANDQFQQVFIISHVDDIRTSPILDEIWQVKETADGISRLETVGVGTDIGEI